MAVAVGVSGNRLEFGGFIYDSEVKRFVSSSCKPLGFSLEVSSPLKLDSTVDPSKYSICFLVKKDLRENEIFQVYDKSRDKRMGWCIPLNALGSVEHYCAENRHFLRYAYVAAAKILNEQPVDIYRKIPLLDENGSVEITQFLSESTALLVVSNETLEGRFEAVRWVPSLASLGYFPLTSVDPNLLKFKGPVVSDERIYLWPVSSDLVELQRIEQVYSQAVPYEVKEVFQFFYLYQIIEYLMTVIFKNEQDALVNDIVAVRGDVSATKDALEKVSALTSEKERLKLLMAKYASCDAEMSDLKRVINGLLKDLGRKEGATLATTIYPTRNFIVHQLIDFPVEQLDKMSDLVAEFLIFLPIMLSRFSLGNERGVQGLDGVAG